MTLEQLRARTAPIAETLGILAGEAEADEFAPWVVDALRGAEFYASLTDAALRDARISPPPEFSRAKPKAWVPSALYSDEATDSAHIRAARIRKLGGAA